MALDFSEHCLGTVGQHTTSIGKESVFAVEKLTDSGFRIRTRRSDPDKDGAGRGWGVELTHAQAVEVTKIMAQLCALMAEGVEDDA